MKEVTSEILQKIERFCAYQERCKHDVEVKLRSLGLSESQINQVSTMLEDEGFVNDERFAETYVRSKLKSSWGRQKIVSGLASKRIPRDIIAQAVSAINPADYADSLKHAASKWLKANGHKENRRDRLMRFLMSKGYTYGEISESLDDMEL